MSGRRAVKVPMLALLSLIGTASGVLVDMLLARVYGTSPVADAYRATSMFLTLGAQLFLSQPMLNIVIGLLSRPAVERPETAILALRRVMGMAILLLLPVAVASLLAAAYVDAVLQWVTPGLAPPVAAVAGPMARAFLLLMAPLLVIGVTGAVLQFYGRFWLLAVYRLSLNGFLMLFVWLARDGDDGQALVLSQVTAVATVSLLSIGFLGLLREQGTRILTGMMPPRFDRAVVASFRLAGGPLSLIVTGQLFGFTLLYALSRQPLGAIAKYAYASKFVGLTDVLPQAVIAVLFPNLVTLWANADRAELTRLVSRAVGVVAVAAAVGGLVLAIAAPSLVELLLAHGRLASSDAREIARGVAILALSAPAAACGQILIPLCYATGRQWHPLVISAGQVVLLGGCLPLLDERGLLAIFALFTGQYILSTAFLFHSAARAGLAIGRPLRRTAIRMVPCLVGTGAAVELVRWLCGVFEPSTAPQHMLDLFVVGLVTPLAFYGFARLVRLDEIEPIGTLVHDCKRRLGRLLRA